MKKSSLINLNAIIKNITKNPTNVLLVVAAFGAGFFVAKQMISPPTNNKSYPAYPQYQSEAEVQYPRKFEGDFPDYSDDADDDTDDTIDTFSGEESDYITPDISDMDSLEGRPDVSNAYYDTAFIDTDSYDYVK